VKEAALGIGSNLGDRLESLNRAVAALGNLPGTRILALSKVYETDPVGYAEQPCFLNAALRLETELSPAALLGACLGIEAALGRKRNFTNGPRAIDIDLLLYEGVASANAELTLPHPRMLERAFVLVPLADLYRTGEAPGVSFAAALASLSRDGVRETSLSLG
jgi:2-amino-4-hydroxy-6-hydroxymethyldihydropteridine diphosphokinase